jgi:flagellar hook-length control protein FliK
MNNEQSEIVNAQPAAEEAAPGIIEKTETVNIESLSLLPREIILSVQPETLEKLIVTYGKGELRQMLFGSMEPGERPAPGQIAKALEIIAKLEAGLAASKLPVQKPQVQQAQSETTLKAWESTPKAHVNLVEKPQEFNELLQNAKAKFAELDAREKPKSSEAPLNHDAPEAPKAAFSDPKPVALKQAELPPSQMTRISEEISARLAKASNGTTTFEMTLNPAELGKITVKIIVKAAIATVEVTAENARTAQLLQNCADKIGLALDKGDSKLESFIVNVESKQDYSEQRENQNQNRSGSENGEQPGEEDSEQGMSFAELLQITA